MKKFLTFLTPFTLLFVIGVQIYAHFSTPKEWTLDKPLSTVIPKELPGWSVHEVPLAASDVQVENVNSKLQFDDYVSRKYKKGNIEFTVYIAYWKPCKRPICLVQVHKPDVCWVGTGWHLVESQNDVPLYVHNTPLLPAEYRFYSKNGVARYTYFWHIVNHQTYVNRIHQSTQFTSLHAFLKFGLNQKSEQFFIRLASNTPIQDIWNNPEIFPIQSNLSTLCLARSAVTP